MFKLLLNFTWKEWLLILLSGGFIVAGVWMDLALPEYLADMTLIVTGMSEGTMGDIWRLGGIMMAFATGSIITSLAVAWIGAIVSSSQSARIRKDVFNRVGDFSATEMQRFSVPSLITRSTNDVTQVRIFVAMAIQVLFRAPVVAIWAISRIMNTSWELSLVTFIAVALMVALVTIVVLIAFPKFNKIQKLTDKLNQVTRENLSGIRVVRAYDANDFEQEKFERANREHAQNNLVVNRAMATFWPFLYFLLSGLSVAIYWVGSWILYSGRNPDPAFLGQVVVFSQFSTMIIFAFMMLIMVLIWFPRTLVSAKRIQDVLSTNSTITDGKDKEPEIINFDVKFDSINFKYPGAEKNVLENINFEIAQGTTVAFIGGTGCGKSTIVNLLPRIYDPTGGTIEIGGQNTREMKLSCLANLVGYVPQTATIFGGTVRDNIAFGDIKSDDGTLKPMNDEEIEWALKTAQAWDFVSELEGGLDSDLAQTGKNLSGGQKQRIGIARVLARRPKIIIFDDTFSALDYRTDKNLRASLKRELRDTTIIMVAQRIGTIKDADHIFVVDKGKIVGRGRHDDLMKSCDVYKEIALSQLSKEELDGK